MLNAVIEYKWYTQKTPLRVTPLSVHSSDLLYKEPSSNKKARSSFSSTVDYNTWVGLGLSVNETLEDEFKSWSGKRGGLYPIQVELKGDNIIFHYFPTFYFCKDLGLSEARQNEILWQCVAGFDKWEGDYTIYGRNVNVSVNVTPMTTKVAALANVHIQPVDNLASMVPGSVLWSPTNPLLHMFLKEGDPKTANYTDLAMHEFGHVLGLFDAYGYGGHTQGKSFLGVDISGLGDAALPEAPLYRAAANSVMRCTGPVTSTEIEMLLWGWRNGNLQLYTDSILTIVGAEESQAFFH